MVCFPRPATNSPSSQGNTTRGFISTFCDFLGSIAVVPLRETLKRTSIRTPLAVPTSPHTAPGDMGKRRLEAL